VTTATTKARTVASASKGKPAVWRKTGAVGCGSEFEVESESTTLLTWLVTVDGFGNLTCQGNSEGDRCWPFYQHATCKHCDAVTAFVDSQPVRRVPARSTRTFALVDLFD
jgi:hypothetical protein